MQVVKFRVVPDVEENIFRDIEIGANKTFSDLYQIILDAFDFSNDQLASFYLSNDEWDKGHEIGLMDMGGAPDDENLPTEMSNAYIGKVVTEKDQKIILVHDFLKMWCFYIECVDFKESETADGTVVLSFGVAPDENSKEMEDLFEGLDIEGGNSKSQLTGDPEIDDILNEYNDNEFGEFNGEFENIDDLDI